MSLTRLYILALSTFQTFLIPDLFRKAAIISGIIAALFIAAFPCWKLST